MLFPEIHTVDNLYCKNINILFKYSLLIATFAVLNF